jgi:hypothetical protein
MPKGPNGQKRPADVIRNIVQVMRIATGEEQDPPSSKTMAEESGSKGAKVRKTIWSAMFFTSFRHT